MPAKNISDFFLVPCKPGVRHVPAGLLAGGIGFGEAGDRDEASVLDTKPSFPVWEGELADVGRAAVRLHADELFKIGGLPFGFQFFGLGFGGLFQGEPGEGRPQRACANCVLPSAVLRTIGPI